MDELLALLKMDVNAANALGAIASAVAAFLALCVSAFSVGISLRALSIQRKHNELSVRPLAEVTVADYEDSIRVKVRNNGSGPMIITRLTVSNGTSAQETLIEWMPDLPNGRHWSNFSSVLCNRSLLPGAEIILLELTQYEGEKGYARCRDIVRAKLAPLTVNVECTDIYGNILRPHQKDLSWFGRHA